MNTADDRLAWALERCRTLGLRLTGVRRAVLGLLAERRLPVTLEDVAGALDSLGSFDPATLYRTLVLFKEAEVVRSVGTPHKAGYYLLNVPDEHCHFLICRRCGAISPLPCHAVLHEVEEQLQRNAGYTGVYHELTFYGVCPRCQLQPSPTPVSKLPIRH
jgi:Fe2+ or Zn2+ uptake regulation protein